jgi:hypothetical protein
MRVLAMGRAKARLRRVGSGGRCGELGGIEGVETSKCGKFSPFSFRGREYGAVGGSDILRGGVSANRLHGLGRVILQNWLSLPST